MERKISVSGKFGKTNEKKKKIQAKKISLFKMLINGKNDFLHLQTSTTTHARKPRSIDDDANGRQSE